MLHTISYDCLNFWILFPLIFTGFVLSVYPGDLGSLPCLTLHIWVHTAWVTIWLLYPPVWSSFRESNRSLSSMAWLDMFVAATPIVVLHVQCLSSPPMLCRIAFQFPSVLRYLLSSIGTVSGCALFLSTIVLFTLLFSL